MTTIDDFIVQVKHVLFTVYFYVNSFLLDRLRQHRIIITARRILTESRLSHEDPVTQLIILSFTLVFVFTVTSLIWRAGRVAGRLTWFLVQIIILGAGLWLASQYGDHLIEGVQNIRHKFDL